MTNSDLDRFINGEICFEDIKGFIHEDVSIQGAIICAIQNKLFYSEKEHDLYEKLCYSFILRAKNKIQYYDTYALYAIYLAAKSKCSPHKLDWNNLLEKIKEESDMDKDDMKRGEEIYKDYVRRGSSGYVLQPDD